MNSYSIKAQILAGTDETSITQVADAAVQMFYALARVKGYGQDQAFTEFVDMFNEISVLSVGAMRQIEARRLAAQSEQTRNQNIPDPAERAAQERNAMNCAADFLRRTTTIPADLVPPVLKRADQAQVFNELEASSSPDE